MGICKIGEKKGIDGKWYEKRPFKGSATPCKGCAFSRGRMHANDCSRRGRTFDSVEDGGKECGTLLDGTIWVASVAPKPAQKAKWVPIPLDAKQAKPKIIEIANQLGAENAKLKNQITKLKGAKA